MNQEQNDQLILIAGQSTMGKTASLRNIRNQSKWMYFGTEAGKRIPFKNSFDAYRIADPMQVLEGFDYAIATPEIEGIIIDSLTFLMEMFESQYVLTAANKQTAWGDYQQFFKTIMQDKVIRFERPVIVIAHTLDVYDETTLSMKTSVPVKGALKGVGIESYFSTVVGAKRMSTKELAAYANPHLKITPQEASLEFKYVFQTLPTKKTTGERIRSPMGMFTSEETFIDNDAQMLLDFLKEYYK